jgi:hypothetical protein
MLRASKRSSSAFKTMRPSSGTAFATTIFVSARESRSKMPNSPK